MTTMVDDHHHHHPLPLPVDSDPNPIDWSMVTIRHHDNNTGDHSSVFPPTNHENLPRSPSPPPSPSSSSSSSFSFSPSDSDAWGGPCYTAPFDSHPGKRGGHLISWMSVGLEILRSKLLSVASSFRNDSSRRRGAFWSFWVPAAAVVVSCWIVMARRKRRRRILTPNETRLIDVIKEKEALISQLLHQIAQMNEMLIARHKALAAKVAG